MQAISVSPVLVVIAIAVIVLLAAVCIYLYTTTRIRSLYGNIAIVALAGPGGLVLVTEWLELDFNETSIGFPAAAVAIVALICLTKIELTQSADPNLSLLKQQFDSTDSVADLSEFDPVLLLQQCQNNWEQFDLQCIKEIEVDEEDRDACHSICRMILNLSLIHI